MTIVLALKVNPTTDLGSGGGLVRARLITPSNRCNVLYYPDATDHRVRVYMGSSSFADNIAFTPDHNGGAIIVACTNSTDGTMDVYCNGEKQGAITLPGTAPTFTMALDSINFADTTDSAVVGLMIAKKEPTSGEIEAISNYYRNVA